MFTQELAEMKAMIEAAHQQQVEARNKFADKLSALGYYSGGPDPLLFDHPSEVGKKVHIHIQSDYGKENAFLGYFEVDVVWYTHHYCSEDCPCVCQVDEDLNRRPATAEEIVAVLKNDLQERLDWENAEVRRCLQLVASIPDEETLAKIRRQTEEKLRTNKKLILPVARLLDVI